MALQGMDRSLNSLNSKRNLKLPPIQGALPPSLYGDHSTAWSPRKPPFTHQPARTRVPRETLTLHPQNIVCTARQPPQTRVNTAHRTSFSSARIGDSSNAGSIEGTRGHQFPTSYDVLPPIQKGSQTDRRRSQRSKTQSRKPSEANNGLKIDGEGRHSGRSELASELISERRRERLKEKQKQAAVESDGSLDKKPDKTDAVNGKTAEEKPRKNSTTYVLYFKCKRRGRRGGVCLDNENTLVNVTDQLKEIFLRRNMEEMYLI